MIANCFKSNDAIIFFYLKAIFGNLGAIELNATKPQSYVKSRTARLSDILIIGEKASLKTEASTYHQ